MRTAALVLAALVAAGLIAVVVGGRMVLSFVATPTAAEGAQPKVIEVPAELPVAALAERLAEAGVIGRPSWLALYVEQLYRGPPFQPGEYALSASMSPAEIVDRLSRGAVVSYPVTVSPGENSRQIVAALAGAGLATAEALEAALKDQALIGKLGLPSTTLEGFLFADTYSFAKGVSAEALLEKMVQAYQRGLPPKVLEDARLRGYTELELITVASLIETSGLPEREWPQYAALVRHRLTDGLPLEHGAALAYGVNKKASELLVIDRVAETPFNTFARPGLPPTPIATPGLAALAAAANPVGDARYYAPRAEGGGGHTFCPDEECHRIALERAGLPIPRSLVEAPKRKKRER